MHKERGKKNMAYTIDGKLKVAVSSRALFQLKKRTRFSLRKVKRLTRNIR